MSFLLDTNILSDLRRPTLAHAPLLAWFTEQVPDALYLSVITLGEIRQGIEQLRRRDLRRFQILGRWLDDLTRLYGDRLLPIDGPGADEWGRLRARKPVRQGRASAPFSTYYLIIHPKNFFVKFIDILRYLNFV